MYSVYVNNSNPNCDDADFFRVVADWSGENCKSFIEYNVVDVTDVSTQYDYVGQYFFKHKNDMIAFRLRWL
jgi:hypothetical protein